MIVAGELAPESDRRLTWDGCFNVRDLGGLPTRDGRWTKTGEIIRSDTVERLTTAGWAALHRYGVRTIIDLRDPSEHGEAQLPPSGIDRLSVPVLDLDDDEFWDHGRWHGAGQSGDFFIAVLDHWADRFAAAAGAVVRARPGGVLIHCQAGRDRTGLLAATLLALVDVDPESIVADYELSAPSLQPLYDQWLAAAADSETRERIRNANRSDAVEIRRVLSEIDLATRLLDNGVSAGDTQRLRARLLL